MYPLFGKTTMNSYQKKTYKWKYIVENFSNSDKSDLMLGITKKQGIDNLLSYPQNCFNNQNVRAMGGTLLYYNLKKEKY